MQSPIKDAMGRTTAIKTGTHFITPITGPTMAMRMDKAIPKRVYKT